MKTTAELTPTIQGNSAAKKTVQRALRGIGGLRCSDPSAVSQLSKTMSAPAPAAITASIGSVGQIATAAIKSIEQSATKQATSPLEKKKGSGLERSQSISGTGGGS